MSSIYIVPYVGTGTLHDSFKPRTNGEVNRGALDFRPDPTSVDGFALLKLDQRASDETGMEHLGGWDDTLSSQQRYNQIEDFFGIERSALRNLTIRQMLRDLMTVHADGDTQARGRWKRAAPSRDGWTRIVIGGETIWEEEGEPRPASVSHTENWPALGRLDAVAQDQTWVVIGGSLSNWEVEPIGEMRHRVSTFQQIGMSAQADTHDNQCEGVALVIDRNTAAFAQAFWGARCDPSEFTGYFVRIDHDGANRRLLLRRVVEGSHTDVGSIVNLTWNPPHDIRIHVDGSTISGYVDDTLIATETDTAITEGRNTILAAVRHQDALQVRYGPLTFGDVEPSTEQLATPTSWTFTKTTDQRQVDGSWNAVQDADHYEWQVEEETDTDTWVAFASGTTETTSFSLDDTDGVDWDTTYRARVRAMP